MTLEQKIQILQYSTIGLTALIPIFVFLTHKNITRYSGINKIKVRQWENFNLVSNFIIAILIALSQILIIRFSSQLEVKRENKERSRMEEFSKGLEGSFKDILDNKMKDKSNAIYPGLSIFIVISIKNYPIAKLKLIWDSDPNALTNRISLYLDIKNNLVFRIVDAEGEIHTLKVPQKLHTFQEGGTYVVNAEYGHSTGYSFMKIVVNKTELARIEMAYRLNFPELTYHNQRLAFPNFKYEEWNEVDQPIYLQFFTASDSTLSNNSKEKLYEVFQQQIGYLMSKRHRRN